MAWLNRERPIRSYSLRDFELINSNSERNPFDIFLVEEISRISDVIRWISQNTWTDAALCIRSIHDIEASELKEIVKYHHEGEHGD